MSHFRKNVIGLFFGQASRLLIQAAYFVVLARMLGASDYGAFASALALAALAIPFSSVGTNTLMLKNVSRRAGSAPREWRRAMIYTICGGLICSLMLYVLADLVLPSEISPLAFFQIALAELIGLKLVELVGILWQAMGRGLALMILPSILNLLRLGAAVGVFLIAGSSSPLELWATVYMWSSLPLGLLVAAHTTYKVGSASFRVGMSVGELREGLLYSVSMASQNVHNDIDKAMLARISSASSAGIYSAAYRIIDMAYAPIRSVATAAYPLYFKEGEQGLSGALRLTKKLAPVVLTIGVVAGVSCALIAPLAPVLLGTDYENAVSIVRALAPLVLLRGLTFLAADTLTGCGRQGFRTIVQIAVAGINVVLNLALIPLMGVTGAVVSTLTCEVLLSSVLWVRIFTARRNEKLSRTTITVSRSISDVENDDSFRLVVPNDVDRSRPRHRAR